MTNLYNANVTVLTEKPETFTVFQLHPDGKLTDKEHLDNVQEAEEWLMNKQWPVVKVVRDSDGKERTATREVHAVVTEDDTVEFVPVYHWN